MSRLMHERLEGNMQRGRRSKEDLNALRPLGWLIVVRITTSMGSLTSPPCGYQCAIAKPGTNRFLSVCQPANLPMFTTSANYNNHRAP